MDDMDKSTVGWMTVTFVVLGFQKSGSDTKTKIWVKNKSIYN